MGQSLFKTFAMDGLDLVMKMNEYIGIIINTKQIGLRYVTEWVLSLLSAVNIVNDIKYCIDTEYAQI